MPKTRIDSTDGNSGTATATAAPPKAQAAAPATSSAKGGHALEIKDPRTNKSYSVPVVDGAIRAVDLKKVNSGAPDDPGLMSYDPAFLNTAACRSAITFIDGDKGILRYRGYPI